MCFNIFKNDLGQIFGNIPRIVFKFLVFNVIAVAGRKTKVFNVNNPKKPNKAHVICEKNENVSNWGILLFLLIRKYSKLV